MKTEIRSPHECTDKALMFCFALSNPELAPAPFDIRYRRAMNKYHNDALFNSAVKELAKMFYRLEELERQQEPS